MQTKEDIQKQAIKEVLSSDYMKYALYGVGAVIAILSKWYCDESNRKHHSFL